MTRHPARITVVGIGADGWAGLTAAGRDALSAAEVVLGSPRHLTLLPGTDEVTGVREQLPSPLVDGLPPLLARYEAARVAVLASGDPLQHGIGTTLIRLCGPDAVTVVPHLSSVTLTCARLGWPVQDVDVVSLVARDPHTLLPALQPGRRIVVLSQDAATPRVVADLLRRNGFGDSRLTLLGRLGAQDESRTDAIASQWPDGDCDPLNVLAVHCVAALGTRVLPRTPGLPDDAFEHDGQLTKREVRAVALAHLAPFPGGLLWDVGAGAGSVAIEWMRTHPTSRAVAVEADPDRADRIGRNALSLGVPGLQVVHGSAPQALTGLPQPDCVFVGGGAGRDGVLDACWEALPPGGRIVVNAVTLETEALLVERYRRHGGELVQVAVTRIRPIGSMLGRAPAMPVTLWTATKPHTAGSRKESS